MHCFFEHALAAVQDNRATAFLFFDKTARDAWMADKLHIHATVKTLSETGNTLEAAANLFEYLHELDTGITCINAQLVPENGLGIAINDRLKKAGYR